MVRWCGFKGIAGLVMLGLASASCATILGIDKDYHAFVDEGGGGGEPTGSVGASAPCTPMGAEICDDGIDNDCNMATDCEDPTCEAGFVCVPAIPSGWSAVAFSAQSRPACPAGYATAADVVSAPSAASACVCTCAPQTAPSCVEGMVGIASNGAGQCPASPNIFLDANSASCGDTNLNTLQNGKVKIAPLPPTQGTCSASVTSVMVPPVQGRSCGAAAVGAGCPGGGACVTSLSAPFVACIEHDGAAPCPAGFPKGTSVGTSATGDMGGCSPCSCGTSATCSSPRLTLFTDGSCSPVSKSLDLPVTDVCDPTNDGSGDTYKSFRYTAVIANEACGKTVDTAPTGSLVFAGERTVCCQ